MGFWDVLLFTCLTVWGPRWIAAAGRTTALRSSIVCGVARLRFFFFVPTAMVITTPRDSGIGAAIRLGQGTFGDFHGFWPDELLDLPRFYFPGLLLPRGD